MQNIDEMSVLHTVTTIETQPAVWIAGPHCVRHEAVGEAYNPQQMQRVVTAVQASTSTFMPAWLIPEP